MTNQTAGDGPVYTHKDFERVKNSRSEEGWKAYAIKRGFNDARLNQEIIMDYGMDSRLVTETYQRSSKPIEKEMQKLQVSDFKDGAKEEESIAKRHPTLTVKGMSSSSRGEETRLPSDCVSESGGSVTAQATSGGPSRRPSFALSAPFPNDQRKLQRSSSTFGLRGSSSLLYRSTQDRPPSTAVPMSQPPPTAAVPISQPPSTAVPISKPPSTAAVPISQPPSSAAVPISKPPSTVDVQQPPPIQIKNFQPFADRVVVERLAAETKDGIMTPENAQGKVLEATVVAIGHGYRTEEGNTVPMHVKVGDRVLLPEYGGFKMTVGEKEYHIFRESDIIGKFTDGHGHK